MKKTHWIKFRHRVVQALLMPPLSLYCRWQYGIKVDRFQEQGDRPYLILYNHQTAFDQFFVGMAFRGPVYYLASEDLFSNGWVSSLIRWLVAPIPIKKQAGDPAAVKNCIRVAREGGTIAIAPEGNRTYSGKTEYMKPAIAGLARKLHMPIALFRIEGGYGVHPRWSDVLRKGRMRGYVAQVIEPSDYDGWTNEALFEKIETGLFVDEAVADAEFHHTKRAEYLERAMYVCPFCGLSEFESHDAVIRCKRCGREVAYGADKSLSGVGFDFPFPFVSQWYAYQKDYVNDLNLESYRKEPMYRDHADLYQVILHKRKNRLAQNITVELYGDRVVLGDRVLPFEAIWAMAVLGRNKLNIYHGDELLQLKSHKRFNALKYVNIYYRNKNIRGGENGEFLGL